MKGFQSQFKDKLHEYVAFRESLGFSYSHHRYLLLFDEYCHTFYPNEVDLTRQLVHGWLKSEIKSGGKAISNKQAAIRSFAKYLGGDAYVLAESFCKDVRSFHPNLLTDSELAAFFSAADRLKKPRDPFFAETAGVLLRLLYTCGLRPTEVRNIKRSHIDFDTGEIFISKSKLSKDRIVVASNDMLALLKEYDGRRSSLCETTEEFFIHTNGNPITKEQLVDLVCRCWKDANPDVEPSLLPRLRPYDLRHQFASNVLHNWLDEGKNLYAQMPYLRAYMGHEDFRDTLYYVHILPERLLASANVNWEQIESAGLGEDVWSR